MFSRSVVSDSLRPHEPQHARPPCPSPTPGIYPNPCPLSQWCHPTISSSVFLLPSIFPSIRISSDEPALCIRWPKYWSFSFNISPSKEHPRLIGSPCSARDSQESSPTPQFKSINSSALSFLYSPALTCPYMTTGKTIALTGWNFVGKVMSLLLNMLSRLVITFLPRSKHLLISWLQWFWSPQNKVCHCFHCFPIYFPWSDGTGCHDLCFLNVEL